MDRRRFVRDVGLIAATFCGQNRLAAAASSSRLVDPLSLGARADGLSDDRVAIQRAIDACGAAGGGTVLLSPGRVFLSGAVELRSNVLLYLAAGATLRASPDRARYGEAGALVFARDADGCGVAGPGTIDGNFRAFLTAKAGGGFEPAYTFLGRYDPEQAGADLHADGRPRMLLFVGCRRVALRDIRIVGAPTWTVHLLGCRDVSVTGISIANEITVPNCDGIDVDRCRRVRIAACDIVAGDDAVCLKASATFPQFGPCEDVTVTGCTLTSGSSAIKLGSAALSPIRNVVASNCVISDSNRGVALQNRDGAGYENILFSDLVIETRYYPREWWGAAEPIHLSNLPRRPGQASAGTISGISFADIRCSSESGAFLYGAPGSPVSDISFDNVSIDIAKRGGEAGGFYDLRPSWSHPAVERSSIAGIHAEGIDGLALADTGVRFRAPADSAYGPALFTRRVSGLDLAGFRGKAARAGVPAQISR